MMNKDATPELVAEVFQVIKELAPHFDANLDRDYLSFPRPKVVIWDLDGMAHYWGFFRPLDKCRISFPSSSSKVDKKVIAHEVGHWYHNMINPEGFDAVSGLGGLGKELEYVLREGVGFYSEICLGLGRGRMTDPEFSLEKFVRITPSEAILNINRIIPFFYTSIKPLVII